MGALSFLNAGILALTAAAVLPILIHLFAKKKPRTVIFSSLAFIKKSTQSDARRINIRNILLLIARILIILLFILAIARPAVNTGLLTDNKNHPATAVGIIIDNSYSMDYLKDTITDFETAQQIALEISGYLSERDMVVLATRNALYNKIYSRLEYGGLDERALKNMQVSSIIEAWPLVIHEVAEKLAQSHLINKEIYIIGDGQAEAMNFDTDIPIYYIPTLEYLSKNNLSCQNARLIEKWVDKDSQRQISFETHNHGPLDVEDIICQLVLNGATVSEQAVSIKSGQSKQAIFNLDLTKEGWNSGHVQVLDERYPYDNKSYFSFYYEPYPLVGVITDQVSLPPNIASVLEIFTEKSANIKLLKTSNISEDELDKYACLVVWDKWQLSELLLANLATRACLYLVSEASRTEYTDTLEKIFAIEFNGFDTTTYTLDYFHPLQAVTASVNKQYSLPVQGMYQIKNNGQAHVAMQASKHPVLISKDNNWLLLCDPGQAENQLWLDPVFPIIGLNILNSIKQNPYQTKKMPLGSSLQVGEGQITNADGRTSLTTSGQLILNKAGIYRLPDKSVLAVDIDYTESSYVPASAGEYKKFHYYGTNWQDKILATRYGYELWRALLLAVLCLIVFEYVLLKLEANKAHASPK